MLGVKPLSRVINRTCADTASRSRQRSNGTLAGGKDEMRKKTPTSGRSEQGSRRSPALSFSSSNGAAELKPRAKGISVCVGPALRAPATRISHMPGGSPRHRSRHVEMKRRSHQWHRTSCLAALRSRSTGGAHSATLDRQVSRSTANTSNAACRPVGSTLVGEAMFEAGGTEGAGAFFGLENVGGPEGAFVVGSRARCISSLVSFFALQ